MATPTIEEYLEAIYLTQGESSPVISARVAERMGVSAPTMADTLKRLVSQGLITVSERKELSFTEEGKRVVESLVRRHRLSERWLTDVLGFDWSRAHHEACKLEHAISPEVEDRLSQTLGNPTTCPHGNPIPGTLQGPMEESVPLSKVSDGDEITVVRVSESAEEDIRLLEYLQRNKIVPGARLKVVEVAPWAGTVTVCGDGGTVSVGMQAAAQVWVVVGR